MPFYRGDAARVDDLRRAVTHGGIFDVGRVGPERGRSGRCASSGQPLARASVSYLSATVKPTVSPRETHRHQLVILSAASQRQDHGLSFPPNLKAAAHKVISPGSSARGSWKTSRRDALPIWRRHDHERPIALRVTPAGLSAIPPAGDRGQLVAASPKSAAPSPRSGRKPKHQRPRARLRQYPGNLCGRD
jgi:hypothetical protein